MKITISWIERDLTKGTKKPDKFHIDVEGKDYIIERSKFNSGYGYAKLRNFKLQRNNLPVQQKWHLRV